MRRTRRTVPMTRTINLRTNKNLLRITRMMMRKITLAEQIKVIKTTMKRLNHWRSRNL